MASGPLLGVPVMARRHTCVMMSLLLALGACWRGQDGAPGQGGHVTPSGGGGTPRAQDTVPGPGGIKGGGGGSAGGGGPTPLNGTTWTYDPDKALATSAPGFPATTHPLAPTSLWGAVSGVRPTNAFWSNLVLARGEDRINLLPYDVHARAQTLEVSSPANSVNPLNVLTADAPQITLGAAEPFADHALAAQDLFSATMRWRADDARAMTAPLVHGMAYVTARYSVLTPAIGAAGNAILSVNGAPPGGGVSGGRFLIALNSGQTWVIYANPAITLAPGGPGLVASAPYTGDLRVALVADPSALPVLDAHAGAIPLGGRLGAAVSDALGQVSITWDRAGTGPLLMMSMQHHRDHLAKGTALLTSPRYSSVAGDLLGIEGDQWVLDYPLPAYDFDPPTPIDPARAGDLAAALAQDASFVPDPGAVAGDPYGAGKQLAKLARLAVIARQLGQAGVATTLVQRLEPLLNAWLDGTSADPLLYDGTWGGIISTHGKNDPGADYGQGYYNDHHFHYGYMLYAAAVIAREDPAWVKGHGDRVLALARDIMNPSATDPFFTPFRHFDFFAGHSWAAGLFTFGDGRNQESTSEAVNAWYAAYLYGRAAGLADLENLGRILFAIEASSAQTYWQIPDASPVYAQPFLSHHVVGVLWETKVEGATWFGTNLEYQFGIQMIPFTPASETLLARPWIRDSWADMARAAAGAAEGWKGFLLSAHAVIDPATAWNEVAALSEFDDGNSRTNVLHWVATRPR